MVRCSPPQDSRSLLEMHVPRARHDPDALTDPEVVYWPSVQDFRPSGGRLRPVSVRASIGLVAAAAGLLTILAGLTSVASLVSRDPALHVAVETAAALISVVAAQLMYGRFEQGYQLRDLLLTASLTTF